MTFLDPIAAVRKEQSEEHRRKTLTANKRPAKPHTISGLPSKKPFVPKGHDAILDRTQKEGSRLKVSLISGDEFTGKVKARDKFTITLETESGAITIFKHAIEYFFTVNSAE